MNKLSVALFGATGDMGTHILGPLLEDHCALIALDIQSSDEQIQQGLKSDIIIFSIPQKAVCDLLSNVALREDQLVIEICSCKKELPAIVGATGAKLLSLHPMNGPSIPWKRQKWIIVGEVPSLSHANWFLDLLRDKSVMFHTVANAQEHDLLMSFVLGIPEFISVFLTKLFENIDSDGTKALETLRMTSPAYASLIKTHVHTICSSAPWLRKQLLLEMHPDFMPLIKKTCAEVASDELYLHIDAEFQQQLNSVKYFGAPEEFVPEVSQHATEDFHFMNAMFLGEGIQKNTELFVQKICTSEELTSSAERVRIGIHGLHGSFTDEALDRFMKEKMSISEDQYSAVELVHSTRVLQAVESGEVDLGIFAFANSGSGGYLDSIEAMGSYNYELLAMFTMPIAMCIITMQDVEHVNQLKRFYGHPIALSQCRKTLQERWPDITVEACTDEMDTALSAKLLADGTLNCDTGVFASKRAAELYGLKVLEEGVHHDPSNATAFAIIRRRST